MSTFNRLSEFSVLNINGKDISLFERSDVSKGILKLTLGDGQPLDDIVHGICKDLYMTFTEDYYFRLRKTYRNLKLESSGEDRISVAEYVDALYYSERYAEKNPCVESFTNVVRSFFKLCIETVFSPTNVNLSDEGFRKFGFVKELICPHEVIKGKGYYEFGLNDPFVLAAVLRIANSVKKYYEFEKDKSESLSVLRCTLFARLSERVFNRFMYINNKSYRLVLNRHLSKLLACPRNELSSIEDIKPIRLFEKITAFILQKINEQQGDIKINICVIGHTEALANNGAENNEAEWMDLLSALIIWYSSKNTENKLNIAIDNLINKNDYPAMLNRDGTVTVNYEFNDNKASCNIIKTDYSQRFEFTTDYLCRLIAVSDMVFILDCPWLTRENFEIDKTVAMSYFCKELSELDESANIIGSRIDVNQTSLMRRLDTQFNRIMASNTFDAGKICRVLKDYIPRKIEAALSRADGSKKIVYMFLSESIGSRFSYLVSYPLQRVENYEGKNFNIFQFCNYRIPTISESNNGSIVNMNDAHIKFNIKLWSIIKYISIGYAFEYFRNIIGDVVIRHQKSDVFTHYNSLNDIDYISIYRSVFAVISIGKNSPLKPIINIGFKKYILDILNEAGVKELYDVVSSLLNPLFRDVIFNSKDNIGNSHMRMAFSMNMYSAAANDLEMYVWHKYRMAIESRDFSAFDSPEFLDNYVIVEDNCDETIDFIMDKWIYDIVLKNLEFNDDLTMGQVYIVQKDAPNRYKNYHSLRGFLTRVLDTCYQMDAIRTKLYMNVKKALAKI